MENCSSKNVGAPRGGSVSRWFGVVAALAAAVLVGCDETLSNRYVTVVTGDDGACRIYRSGADSPFAELPAGAFGDKACVKVRLDADSPFVFFDVAPRSDCADYVPGRLSLGPAKLAGVGPGWRMMGSGGLTNASASVCSYAFLAIAEPKSRRGYVAAWLTDEWASGLVSYGPSGLEAVGEYGPMLVKRGSARKSDVFVLGAFDDCRIGLEQYADAVSRHYGIALPAQMSGFCTWYTDKGGYTRDRTRFENGACSEKSTREFIDRASSVGLGKWGFGYYQIDDRWQAGREYKGPALEFREVRKDGPYPNGLEPTVGRINAAGFVAGLWCMPFSGEPHDAYWADKSNLFVRVAYDTPAGKPGSRRVKGAPYWTPFGAGALDMTNPDAVEYMKGTVGKITKEWGMRMIKFDGMYSGMAVELGHGWWHRPDDIGNQVFHDREASNAQAFRRGLKAMRGACADGTQFLACNVKQNARGIAASYGLVEMLRIGGDNGPIDCFPARYMAGPLDGSPRYFLNGRVWYNDPDPVYVRDAVPLSRARLFATWTSIGGLLYNFSDWLPDLSDGRVELLKRTMAPHRKPRQVRPVDYFERQVNNVWKLTDGDRAVFGLYNWNTNAALCVDYDAAYCDLDPDKTYAGFDFWANEPVPAFKGRFKFDVPPDSCRAIAVREALDRPFVISTSRHVASPVFDVVEERWDEPTRTLSGRSVVVPGEPYEIRIVHGGRLLRERFVPQSADFAWKVRVAAR